ncbi:erythromycin esterase-like protein [Dyadobacter sp. BE34]|uniref:Erythromycin esterase-like protein n=1 Tax=Dyadobacter fermentans TaxID=94254 RepID=A0ABU1R089_9BACT|nr:MULTISPECIES: erythromycin esterase family protein [Dyadobacter]MDR6806672.1 erythromycin esterase-like protein [Dyadobacter fermentans]MDR7044414.1 erythromycin esterase-like protein [Dyadobacter sp. BE242]MDR7198724.1 erythromycin esterase-like protein [Dyadobacter sp. BE34]MDR7216686.1 erythromycin esterase-like protein [Dyadobacter sp. BE31]MDR7263788.1 erythromycin esterase-like protein [Dyadobacter sp. BE32]
MKLSCLPFLLIFSFLYVCCTPVQVNGQDNGLVDQLKGHIVRLDSLDLAGENNVRMMSKALPGEFRVLGIGEQSHGTSEFFTARLLLIRALAADSAFTKIGVEAPMAEVDKLNDYLWEGRGDLKAILRSFRLYGYECPEFVNLVESVGRIGKARGKAIRFFGFDMQSPFQSLQNLRDSGVASDISDSLKNLMHYYELLNNEVYNHSISAPDFAELKTLSDWVLDKLTGKAQTNELVRKSIRSYRQFLLLSDSGLTHAMDVQSEIRDSLMAENVLAEMEPGRKMVLLAHNGHLQRTPNIFSKSTGSFLARKLGGAYQCVGLTTSYGFYTTVNPTVGHITDKNEVFAGDSTTWEYHFSKLAQPVFFFNMAVLKQSRQGLHLPGRYRLLVYGLADNQFFDGSLADDFDYILHIRETSGNHSFYLK